MRQDTAHKPRMRTCGFTFVGMGKEQQTPAQPSVICGRAATWQRPHREDEDGDGFEPNIVRGRE